MDISTIAILFAIGFIIGLFGRLFYASMSGQLRLKKPGADAKVYYFDQERNDATAEHNEEHEARKDKKVG